MTKKQPWLNVETGCERPDIIIDQIKVGILKPALFILQL